MTEQEIIRIKALLDESGNGSFPSDTNIITHNKIPLRDYIDQKIYTVPDGFNYNDKKIVIIENIDITTLRKNIINGFTVNCTGLPISGHNGYINTRFYTENVGCIEFINDVGKWKNLLVGGTWQGWECMTEQHAGVMFMNGWIVNGHEPILTKIGNIVWFNGIIRNGTNTAGTVAIKIPAGYRPYYIIMLAAISSSGNSLFSIDPNGDGKIITPVPDKTNVQVTGMWRIK